MRRTLGLPCVSASRHDLGRIRQILESEPKREMTIDLAAEVIRFGSDSFPASIRPSARDALIKGQWDPIGELLEAGLFGQRTGRAIAVPMTLQDTGYRSPQLVTGVPYQVLFQDPFDLGHSGRVGEKRVTGRDDLFRFRSFQDANCCTNDAVGALGSAVDPAIANDAMIRDSNR